MAIFTETYIEKYKNKNKLSSILPIISTVLDTISALPALHIGIFSISIKNHILKDKKVKESIYKISKECQNILRKGIDKNLIRYIDFIEISDKQISIDKNDKKYKVRIFISTINTTKMFKDYNILKFINYNISELYEDENGKKFIEAYTKLCDDIDAINSIIKDQKNNHGLKYYGIEEDDLYTEGLYNNYHPFISIEFSLKS